MLVYVRGAGDIATGVAARLVRAGVSVIMADIAVPTCIRRTISFCEAIRLGEVEVEGIRARLAQTPAEALAISEAGDVAVQRSAEVAERQRVGFRIDGNATGAPDHIGLALTVFIDL